MAEIEEFLAMKSLQYIKDWIAIWNLLFKCSIHDSQQISIRKGPRLHVTGHSSFCRVVRQGHFSIAMFSIPFSTSSLHQGKVVAFHWIKAANAGIPQFYQ
eukprot:10601610-Ditylum_brightwellii.AAC.1